MKDNQHGLGEPVIEYAVEVTWADWKKAGAKGPTSQYGPFENQPACENFLADCKRNRDIAATRVFTRYAAYTSWDTNEEPLYLSREEREQLILDHHNELFGTMITFEETTASN